MSMSRPKRAVSAFAVAALQLAACGEVELAADGAVCSADADCSSEFCDRGTCATIVEAYGQACFPGGVGKAVGGCRGGYGCLSGRCRSCVSDVECRIDRCVGVTDCAIHTSKCYRRPDKLGAWCGSREKPLSDWVPVESCGGDADCPADSFCDLNACLRRDIGTLQGSPYGSECTTSEVCGDYPCIAGRCRSCAAAGDCPTGRECVRAWPEGMACVAPP